VLACPCCCRQGQHEPSFRHGNFMDAPGTACSVLRFYDVFAMVGVSHLDTRHTATSSTRAAVPHYFTCQDVMEATIASVAPDASSSDVLLTAWSVHAYNAERALWSIVYSTAVVIMATALSFQVCSCMWTVVRGTAQRMPSDADFKQC
jgi:hypothetical protein